MTKINYDTLTTLLPHDGTMCLLDQVVSWDNFKITCVAKSHTLAENPLRIEGQLPIEAGIEYAAQAMAIHGTLSRSVENGSARSEMVARGEVVDCYAPRVGYLAVLSHVQWMVQRLDTIPGDLIVYAEKLMVSADGSSYQFSLKHDGQTIISGQAIVALAAETK